MPRWGMISSPFERSISRTVCSRQRRYSRRRDSWFGHSLDHRTQTYARRGLRGGGAILTFFGLIHGEKIGFGSSPEVPASSLAVAAILYFYARHASFAP